MPLINCKVELSLKWYERCLLTVANTATFKITDAKLYVPIVTLSAEDNAKLSKLLSQGWRGVKRLFVLAYDNKQGDNKVSVDSYKYFFPIVKIENYNIEIVGRNFYDQLINDSIKQYDEIRKISTGGGVDYTNGYLLDCAYFEKN